MIHVALPSPAATASFGRALADCLSPPALVTLAGELGTGKTALVRAVFRRLGVREQVVSPSFTIAQSYYGNGGVCLHHLDLYRLSPGDDAALFPWEDYVGAGAITFVEWPEAADRQLPPADVCIRLYHEERRSRRAEISACASVEAELLSRLRAADLDARAAVSAVRGQEV